MNIVSENNFELGPWDSAPLGTLDDSGEVVERAATTGVELVAVDMDEDDSPDVDERVEVEPADTEEVVVLLACV